jgi:hypothetical protein
MASRVVLRLSEADHGDEFSDEDEERVTEALKDLAAELSRRAARETEDQS